VTDSKADRAVALAGRHGMNQLEIWL
jgi:hypothetical protein